MFDPQRILYEDNHLLIVNKQSGELVQPDRTSDNSLGDALKEFIKVRDSKPGEVFMGVAHRIDRPVSGVVLFAKTSKALVRVNEQIRERTIAKTYWAITEGAPQQQDGELVHHMLRDGEVNRSKIYDKPVPHSKEAKLRYRHLASGDNYHLIEVELITGRHHQIRAQLARIGCPIKGDLKYGARRSNRDGSISLHARTLTFTHPVRKEQMTITAPVPDSDNLWMYFAQSVK